MNLSIGIVGLPNVGKSTLFNALLKRQIANVANYPFCTIEPNVGVIEVPDDRLPQLASVVNTQTIIPAVVQFYDIAGLVKGASTGEGLGNKFLSHIREVAALLHVTRLFEDDNIIHVDSKLDPVSDIQTIETELILADLATVSKQVELKMKATREEIATFEVVKKVKADLNQGSPVRNQNLTPEEIGSIKHLNLLTLKPVLYVFNISETQLEDKFNTEQKIKDVMNNLKDHSPTLYICAKLETDVGVFAPEEQKEYLKQYNLDELGLNRLIKCAYNLLDLISFLTAGEKEVRAWTIKQGTLAGQAAGVIHTDLEKKFIKADIVPYQTFIDLGGWTAAREQGKVNIVGKDYIMQDNEVVEFKIGS